MRPRSGAVWTSAMRAMIPPSPSLSARMMNVTYLIETMIVTDHTTSEIMPYTPASSAVSPAVAKMASMA
jgi:hypothetical protein